MILRFENVSIDTKCIIAVEWDYLETGFGDKRSGIRVLLSVPSGSFGYLDGGAGYIDPHSYSWFGPQAEIVAAALNKYWPASAVIDLPKLCDSCGMKEAVGKGSKCERCEKEDMAREIIKQRSLDNIPF